MLFSVSHDFHLPLPPFSAISISSAWNEHGLSLMFQFRWWKRKRITVTLPSWMWLYNLKFNIRLRFDLVGWDGIVFCCCCCWCVVWFVWWKLLFGLHAKKTTILWNDKTIVFYVVPSIDYVVLAMLADFCYCYCCCFYGWLWCRNTIPIPFSWRMPMKMDLECGHDRKNHQQKSTTHTHKNAKSTFIVDDSVTTKFSANNMCFF